MTNLTANNQITFTMSIIMNFMLAVTGRKRYFKMTLDHHFPHSRE